MVISSVLGKKEHKFCPCTLSQHTLCNCGESADSPVPKCFMIRDERKCLTLVAVSHFGGNCVCISPVSTPLIQAMHITHASITICISNLDKNARNCG